MGLVLAGAAFGRIATLLLQVNLSGSDPPQVRSLGRIRRSSDVDSCQLLGAARLGFLTLRTQRRCLCQILQINTSIQRRRLRLQDAGP